MWMWVVSKMLSLHTLDSQHALLVRVRLREVAKAAHVVWVFGSVGKFAVLLWSDIVRLIPVTVV